jgi:mannose-6-phosphate isomerase-like protein (cupin superfamily)
VPWQTAQVRPRFDALAPDGSEIRLLVQVADASMVHCTLPPGSVTQAVEHRTVEEVWYCLSGAGQLWRRDTRSQEEEIVDLQPGVAVTIPLGTRFQFRASSAAALEVVITTMPPWPGNDEAVAVEGTWEATV